MNVPLVYQWKAMIDKGFPGMGRWQTLTLALLSYGILLAPSCRLSKVCQPVSGKAENGSLERRFQRGLAKVAIEPQQRLWVRWVLRVWGQGARLIRVDETQRSDHVAVMRVGVAYPGSASPLLWRAYAVQDYPLEGQVGRLNGLLDQLRARIPPDQALLLLALA
jgi:hypothetical protein